MANRSLSPANQPLLTVTGLRKTWPASQASLTLPRLEIRPGTVQVMTGTNGSGKTTMLRILAGFLTPDPGGACTWQGQAGHWPRPGCDSCLLHQQPHLLDRSVAANVAYVLRLRTQPTPMAADILDMVGLAPLANHHAHQLSAGEQRRLALARILVTTAPLVLLDEPTANLDDAGIHLVSRLVRKMADDDRAVLLAIQASDIPTALADCPVTTLPPPCPGK